MFANRKKLTVALSALFVASGAAGIVTAREHASELTAAETAAAIPAVDVDVASVIHRSITEWQSYSGRLEAIDKVEVRPLVAGTIVAVHVTDGALVNKGDALFTIDPQPYLAEVERAAAQLAAAEARAAYTASDAARADRLLSNNAIARRDFDEKHNAQLEAAANLKAAKAALSAAKINLAYTNVVAPVAGRVSRAEITIGNVVTAGASAPLLTTVVSVSPMYASFNVDEQTYLRYLSQNVKGAVPVWLGLADENGYSREGEVVSVDNQLDPSSGTIRVRARFDNSNGALLPGLYARLKVGGVAPHDALLIDESAIGTDQAKKFVLVVDDHSLVRYREVTLGSQHEGLRVVTAGLQPGERIVVNGTQRVRPNDVVRVRDVDMADLQRNAAPSA